MNAPYQTSCSAALVGKVLSGCSSHRRPSDKVATYYNITSPTPVPQNGQPNGGGGCDCTAPFTSTASGSIWSSDMNGSAEWWLSPNSPTDMLTNVQSFASGSVIDLGTCHKYGWKGVASNKMWHGTYEWLSNDSCAQSRSMAPDQTKYLELSGHVSMSWNFNDYDADGNLYYSLSAQNIFGDFSKTINRNTGTFTVQDTVVATTASSWNDFALNWKASLNSDVHCLNDITLGSINYATFEINPGDLLNFAIAGSDYFLPMSSSYTPTPSGWSFHSNQTQDVSASTYPQSASVTQNVNIDISRTNTDYNFSTSVYFKIIGQYPDTVFASETDFTYNGNLTLSVPYTSTDLVNDCQGLLAEWPLGDDTIMPYQTHNLTPFMPLVIHREVQHEVPTLGFVFDTIDDYVNPIFLSGSIIGYEQIPWQDPNAYWWNWIQGSSSIQAISLESQHFDGSIIGKPLLFDSSSHGNYTSSISTGSYTGSSFQPPYTALGTGWFDYYYVDTHFCVCPCDCGTPYEQFTYAGGASLADAEVSVCGAASGQFINLLPIESTHFVNNIMAHSIPRGASINSEIGYPGLTMVKYCETRPPLNSHNWFRPCGQDRVAIDEPTAQCFINAPLTMQNDLIGLTGGSQVLLYQTSGYDGIYTGCSSSPVGDGTYLLTLGTLVSHLPTDYTHLGGSAFYDGSSAFGLCGLIRFPDAWSLCGRQSLSATASGSGTLLTFSNTQTNLRTNDTLDLFNLRMVPTVSSQSISRIDDNNFFISSSYSGSIMSSVYAISTGAPSYFWNDTTPKLTFRTATSYLSHRSSSYDSPLEPTASCYQDCIGVSSCSPSTVVFSPNAESFGNNAKKYWNGSPVAMDATGSAAGSFQADGVFGAIHQENVEFEMAGPFFQVPKVPCQAPSVAQQDDGTCQVDYTDDSGVNHFIFPKSQVEAVCSQPIGSPVLPSSVTIPMTYSQPLPGIPGYSFNLSQSPVAFMTNQLSISCSCPQYNYKC